MKLVYNDGGTLSGVNKLEISGTDFIADDFYIIPITDIKSIEEQEKE